MASKRGEFRYKTSCKRSGRDEFVVVEKGGTVEKEDDDGRLTGDQRMDPRGKTRTNILFTQFS